jgi:hypothetical protein
MIYSIGGFMTDKEELQQLLNICRNSTGTDFEGSDTYRLHYKKADELIKKAYDLGKKHARNNSAE